MVEKFNTWQQWCRLCAKQNNKETDSINIFTKSEHNVVDSSLASAIGKYFWVNVSKIIFYLKSSNPNYLCIRKLIKKNFFFINI